MYDPDDEMWIIRIEIKREMLGMSVNDMCKRAGISEATWRRMKNGQAKYIIMKTFLKILNALDLRIEEVYRPVE